MTVKTEMDYDDTESFNDENKKRIQIIDESNDDIINDNNNLKKNEEEHLITNLDTKSSPVKLKAISECIDENVNEANNNSINKANKIEIFEERKNY